MLRDMYSLDEQMDAVPRRRPVHGYRDDDILWQEGRSDMNDSCRDRQPGAIWSREEHKRLPRRPLGIVAYCQMHIGAYFRTRGIS